MNNEEQILRNQITIMRYMSIGGEILKEALLKRVVETGEILNPKESDSKKRVKKAVEEKQ